MSQYIRNASQKRRKQAGLGSWLSDLLSPSAPAVPAGPSTANQVANAIWNPVTSAAAAYNALPPADKAAVDAQYAKDHPAAPSGAQKVLTFLSDALKTVKPYMTPSGQQVAQSYGVPSAMSTATIAVVGVGGAVAIWALFLRKK